MTVAPLGDAKDDEFMSAGHPDPRAKYRHLPAAINLAHNIASVDSSTSPDDPDNDVGATPYLRATLGPWVR